MLLGSGELGKEFTISAQRLGQYIIAVDAYNDAPAMQVAHEREVIDMLNGEELEHIVKKHQPDIIVPEVEAIRTEKLYEFEKQGLHVVPSAKAVNYTMDRKAIRDLAAKELGLKTANFMYASTLEELKDAVTKIGIPCVTKPLMSSSGKGQSIIRNEADIEIAWQNAAEKGRVTKGEIIVEEFIAFESEITLLTVTQKNGKTLFCPPIGHRQERGDYQESWQPAAVKPGLLKTAEEMSNKVTQALGGAGIWGIEFFLTEDEVYFSELSPRPHDTGMVTLSGSQTFSEFELHLRAILGLPIPAIELHKAAASAVILAPDNIENPQYEGLDIAANFINSDFRIFGKPVARPYRRMGVALAWTENNKTAINEVVNKAKEVAASIKVK